MTKQLFDQSLDFLRRLLRRAWALNWPLTLAGLSYLLLIPIILLAALADPRVITGAPAWIKPLKFALSTSIYALTFLWLLSYVQGRRRWVQIAAGVTGLALTVENALIILQVMRGTTSHFNNSTPFDSAVFGLMGAFIGLASLMNLLLAIWLIRQQMPDRVMAWGLRLGVLLSFVGMMVGFLMTQPTPEQLQAAQAGAAMTTAGAHSVGMPDGGPGLPFLGWSTVGGDLRVPHFFGLHAMQLLPLLAMLIGLVGVRRSWSVERRVSLVWIGGIGYLGLMLLLTWQALRGQSVVAPDGLTLAAYALLVGGVALATVITWQRTVRRGQQVTRLATAEV